MFSQIAVLVMVSLAAAQYESQNDEPVYAQTYEPTYESKPEPYSFGYDIKDDYGATQSRKEEGDGYGNIKGSYGYTDGYGLYRQVDYVADNKGFRAYIKTNEPGTDNQNPADVQIQSYATPVNFDDSSSSEQAKESDSKPDTQSYERQTADYELIAEKSIQSQEYHSSETNARSVTSYQPEEAELYE